MIVPFARSKISNEEIGKNSKIFPGTVETFARQYPPYLQEASEGFIL